MRKEINSKHNRTNYEENYSVSTIALNVQIEEVNTICACENYYGRGFFFDNGPCLLCGTLLWFTVVFVRMCVYLVDTIYIRYCYTNLILVYFLV